MDLLRFGNRLDVPLLFEQIWFEITPNTGDLEVVEVYDVLLRNPKGCEIMSEVWALFPHSFYKKGKYDVEVVSLRPTGYVITEYDWPFKGAPQWKDEKLGAAIVREVVFECPDMFGIDTEITEGVALAVEPEAIGVPDIFELLGYPSDATPAQRRKLTGQCEDFLADDKVQKTLLRIPFSGTPLKGGEAGWMRLIVKPRHIDPDRIKVRKIPGIAEIVREPERHKEYVLSNEQRLDVVCPWVLRHKLYKKANEEESTYGIALRKLLERLGDEGTSTRIIDHRIALVAPREGVDVHDAIATTPGILFYGTQDICDDTHTAFVWVCGSNRNQDRDLIHSAMRVINRIALFRETREKDLKRELAPSGLYEAFSLLVNLMKRAGLIINTGPGEDGFLKLMSDNKYDQEHLPQEEDFDFNQLREIYAKCDVGEHDRRLVKQFSDLHPFRILFRVIWLNLGKESKKLLTNVIALLQNPKIRKFLPVTPQADRPFDRRS